MKWLLRRKTLGVGLWFAVGALYLLPLIVVSGAVDYFLKIEGVAGESPDQKHKDWIQLESMQMGVARAITGAGTTRSVGPAVFEDLQVTKWIDKASPVLMLSCCEGKVFPKVEIHRQAYEAGAAAGQDLELTLYDAVLSSAKPRSSGSNSLPVESVSFNFTKIEMSYLLLDPASGGTNYQTNVVCEVNPAGVP